MYVTSITLNVSESELVACRVSVTRTRSEARQEQLEGWTIGQRVPVGSTHLDDCSTRREILIDNRTIVLGELRVIIIHVNQVNNQCTCTCLRRLT